MSFTIDCTCGRSIEVTAAHAGGDVRCVCGSVQAVPALSELRLRAGKSRYGVDIAESIRYMVADGQLPADDNCVSCGIRTGNVLHFVVECARPRRVSPRIWDVLILKWIPLVSVFFGEFSRWEHNSRTVGQEIVVKAPLRICPGCADATPMNRQGEMADLLEKVPLYERLLTKYPCANIASS